jgi:hypothetical protein
MAVVDMAQKTITLKVVYYGCALGGKTTNLVTLHRLTDPGGEHGLVSIATKDDRTLFFDLLPLDLGQIGGLSVRVKAYTVPGQVHYELTRRQVLAKADGVVLVIDSSPDVAKPNAWAAENLRFNLKANGFDPDQIPTVLQWNKRDLPGARPLAELARELNPRGLPACEAVATTGTGVVETFAAVVKGAVRAAFAKTGRQATAGEQLDRTVDQALAAARLREPPPPQARVVGDTVFDHRLDTDTYKEQWAEHGRDRQIVDQATLLSEAVATSMELAERFEGLRDAQAVGERRRAMIEALAALAPRLADPEAQPLAPGLMAGLLAACGRRQGSLLLFTPGSKTMEEREVVPAGPDLLNATVADGLGSVAFRFAQTKSLRLVPSLADDVFFGPVPPEAQALSGAALAPVQCDGLPFGALVVYARVEEPALRPEELEFWAAAGTLCGLSLHWRALRRKVAQAGATPAASSSAGAGR